MPEIVLTALLLSFAAGTAPDPASPETERTGARVFAALAELDRAAATALWPGFDPRETPFEISDGGRTWLLRHPNPPEGFEPVPGHPPSEARVFEGRHDSARANTSAELGGVATAQASFEGKTAGPRALAALLAHEAFHVFQGRRHPKWGADESQLFLFPVEDAEALALRRLESAALSRAVSASDRASRLRWAARALDARRLRFARLPAVAAAYERGTEQKEGLARYIETRVTGASTAALPAVEFPPAAIRDRAYESGCAIALLLDSLDPRLEGSARSVGLVVPIPVAISSRLLKKGCGRRSCRNGRLSKTRGARCRRVDRVPGGSAAKVSRSARLANRRGIRLPALPSGLRSVEHRADPSL